MAVSTLKFYRVYNSMNPDSCKSFTDKNKALEEFKAMRRSTIMDQVIIVSNEDSEFLKEQYKILRSS